MEGKWTASRLGGGMKEIIPVIKEHQAETLEPNHRVCRRTAGGRIETETRTRDLLR